MGDMMGKIADIEAELRQKATSYTTDELIWERDNAIAEIHSLEWDELCWLQICHMELNKRGYTVEAF